jgi:membrane protein YdbS with pleckstrin-like domain
MSPGTVTTEGSAGDPSAGVPAFPGAAGHALRRLPVTLEPDRNRLKYYMLTALLFGPALIFAAVPLWFRFRTLRYDVDAEGITMRWGILFRREVSLTYARIQDIQLTSNVVERWLGLARIQLQTASGSATAEMTIEGRRDVDAIRDFLYSRMRGVQDQEVNHAGMGRVTAVAAATDTPDVTAATAVATVHTTVLAAVSSDTSARTASAAEGRSDASSRTAEASSRTAEASSRTAETSSRTRDIGADVAALTAALDEVAAELRAIRAELARTQHARDTDG